MQEKETPIVYTCNDCGKWFTVPEFAPIVDEDNDTIVGQLLVCPYCNSANCDD